MLNEAFIYPSEPCEAHFFMDTRTIFDDLRTAEQKHQMTAMIELGIARTIVLYNSDMNRLKEGSHILICLEDE